MSVVLRRWVEADAEWYVAAAQDRDIQHFSNEGDVTVDQMRDAIRRLGEREGVFAIADAGSGRAVGNIGWRREDDGSTAEIYYWVEAVSRGRGVASTAVELAVADAIAAGARRLRLVIDGDNVASRRVAERTGFILIGPGTPREQDGHPRETVVYERQP